MQPAKSPTMLHAKPPPPPPALLLCYASSIWCPFCSPPLLALGGGSGAGETGASLTKPLKGHQSLLPLHKQD